MRTQTALKKAKKNGNLSPIVTPPPPPPLVHVRHQNGTVTSESIRSAGRAIVNGSVMVDQRCNTVETITRVVCKREISSISSLKNYENLHLGQPVQVIDPGHQHECMIADWLPKTSTGTLNKRLFREPGSGVCQDKTRICNGCCNNPH